MQHIRRMDKNTRTLLIVGLGAGLLLYFRRQFARFDVGSASVSSMKLQGGGVRINVRLPIINRSNIAVPVSGFLGILTYQGQQIGTTILNQPLTIQPRGVAYPEFGTTVSIASVITSTPLLSLLNSLAKKYLGFALPGIPSDAALDANAIDKYLGGLRLRGTLYAAGVSIDIDQNLSA
jgi:hypothetical protein